MSERTDTIRLVRLALVAYAVWSGVLGAWGRVGPFFPTSARVATGAAMAGICVAVAVFPTPRRIEGALFVVAWFALWSAARVIAADFDSAASIAGAVTYATIAVSALTLAGVTAILAGIERAAEVHRGDE